MSDFENNVSIEGDDDGAPNDSIELTTVESLLFFNIVRFIGDPNVVDWDQVALHSNLKNAGSARVRFRQIQKKYNLEIQTAPTNTAIQSRKRKQDDRTRRKSSKDAFDGVNDSDDDDEEEEEPEYRPAKKALAARKRGSINKGNKNTRNKKAQSDDDEPDFVITGVAPVVKKTEARKDNKSKNVKAEPDAYNVSHAASSAAASQQQEQQEQVTMMMQPVAYMPANPAAGPSSSAYQMPESRNYIDYLRQNRSAAARNNNNNAGVEQQQFHRHFMPNTTLDFHSMGFAGFYGVPGAGAGTPTTGAVAAAGNHTAGSQEQGEEEEGQDKSASPADGGEFKDQHK